VQRLARSERAAEIVSYGLPEPSARGTRQEDEVVHTRNVTFRDPARTGQVAGLGDADADPHRGPSEVSRLLTAAVTPPTAVAALVIVLALGWARRFEAAVLSVSSADVTALVWVLNVSCSSAVSAVSFAWTLPRSEMISLTVPVPMLTCVSVDTESRSAAAAWHTADVSEGVGDAVAPVAPVALGLVTLGLVTLGLGTLGLGTLGDALLPVDEVALEPQAASEIPARSATATMHRRPKAIVVPLSSRPTARPPYRHGPAGPATSHHPLGVKSGEAVSNRGMVVRSRGERPPTTGAPNHRR
jgi:hypothetical protein